MNKREWLYEKYRNKKNKKNKKKIFLLVFLAWSFSSGSFAQTMIEVFVNLPLMVQPIPDAAVMVFDLSRVAALEESMPDFSPDPELAQGQAKAWLESPAGKNHIANLKLAYVGHEKLMLYGIRKIPAIVFDKGKFVIYGSTDVTKAVDDYDNFLHAQNNQAFPHESKK